MRTVSIEIKAVSFIQGQLFIPDLQGHTPFEYVVELLPGMGIEIDGGFFVFGFDGNDERVGFTVHETGSERLIFVCLGSLYAGSFPFAGEEITVHAGFLAKHQSRKIYFVVGSDLVQDTYGNIYIARFQEFILPRFDSAYGGDIGGRQVKDFSSGRGYLLPDCRCLLIAKIKNKSEK